MEVVCRIGKNNLATLVCPRCAWARRIDATKYLGEGKKIKIKVRCRCETTYIAVLDRRKFHRKETDLYGTYVKLEPSRQKEMDTPEKKKSVFREAPSNPLQKAEIAGSVSVNLSGTYTSVKDSYTGEAIIVNLSREGLRFKTKKNPPLKPGDLILIEFHLDDGNRSRIRKRAVVKSVTDTSVGVQFTRVDPTDASDVAIGFYLLTKS